MIRCWLFVSCEGGKNPEACKSGPRARVPLQGDYSRPHQSQETVKPTPNSVLFWFCLLSLTNPVICVFLKKIKNVYFICKQILSYVCSCVCNFEIGCVMLVFKKEIRKCMCVCIQLFGNSRMESRQVLQYVVWK